MKNDMAYKTIGIGSIKIWTHDGVVRTLTNIRHVLELKKNLISLGKLVNGYKFSGEDQILRVSKVSLVVIKEKKLNTLYIIQARCCSFSIIRRF